MVSYSVWAKNGDTVPGSVDDLAREKPAAMDMARLAQSSAKPGEPQSVMGITVLPVSPAHGEWTTSGSTQTFPATVNGYPVLLYRPPSGQADGVVMVERRPVSERYAVWSIGPDGHTYSGFYTEDRTTAWEEFGARAKTAETVARAYDRKLAAAARACEALGCDLRRNAAGMYTLRSRPEYNPKAVYASFNLGEVLARAVAMAAGREP